MTLTKHPLRPAFIITHVPVSMFPPASATQSVFRASSLCLSGSVSTIPMALLLVLSQSPYSSPHVYITRHGADFHAEFCLEILSLRGLEMTAVCFLAESLYKNPLNEKFSGIVLFLNSSREIILSPPSSSPSSQLI